MFLRDFNIICFDLGIFYQHKCAVDEDFQP